MNINKNKELDNSKIVIGKKGKQLWYPTYAPHILLGTDKSILTEIYINEFKKTN